MKKKLHIGLAVVMSGVLLVACNNATSIPEAPSSEAETTVQAETLEQEITEAQSDTEEKYVAIDFSDCKDFKQAIAKLTTDMGYNKPNINLVDDLNKYDITNTAANRSMRDKGMRRVKAFFEANLYIHKISFVI